MTIKADQNPLLQLPDYAPIHQIKNNDQRGGGVVLYVRVLILKYQKTQSITSNDTECACIRIIGKKAKYKIVSCIYQSPRGDSHTLLEEVKYVICKNHEKLLCKFLRLFDKYKCSSNLVLQNRVFLLINRSARETESSGTIIDHVLTKTIIDSEAQSGIKKIKISNHFVVLALMEKSLV